MSDIQKMSDKALTRVEDHILEMFPEGMLITENDKLKNRCELLERVLLVCIQRVKRYSVDEDELKLMRRYRNLL